MPGFCASFKAIRYESTSLKSVVAEKSHHVIVSLDRQIGMEQLVIDWAKEEAKMERIVRNIHVYC